MLKPLSEASNTLRKTAKEGKNTPWPEVDENPQIGNFEAIRTNTMKCMKSFNKTHAGPISSMAFHPKIGGERKWLMLFGVSSEDWG
jgi:hypothetical protein